MNWDKKGKRKVKYMGRDEMIRGWSTARTPRTETFLSHGTERQWPKQFGMKPMGCRSLP